MKNFEAGPYKVGQKLVHCAGTKIRTVTFVSLGPRVGKSVGEDTVINVPETAIVRDNDNNLITVKLSELKPLPQK